MIELNLNQFQSPKINKCQNNHKKDKKLKLSMFLGKKRKSSFQNI